MHKEMGRVFANQEILKERLTNGSRNFDLRILELQDDLGEEPLHLISKFDAPSLWGAVGVMGSSILKVEEDCPDKDILTKDNIRPLALQAGVANHADLEQKLNSVRASHISVARALKSKISMHEHQLLEMSSCTSLSQKQHGYRS